jgi:hypothetical protein
MTLRLSALAIGLIEHPPTAHMNLLQPFQFASSDLNIQRVNLVQTFDFSYLLDISMDHGDVGYFSAPSSLFRKHPGLRIDEDEVLVITVPPYIGVNWAAQTEDWLTPYNTTDGDDGPLRTMLRLGSNAFAIDLVHHEHVLQQVATSLIVVYVLPDCIASVRYRWNPMVLETLDQLFQATKFYASIVAEKARRIDSGDRGNKESGSKTINGSITADGSVRLAA